MIEHILYNKKRSSWTRGTFAVGPDKHSAKVVHTPRKPRSPPPPLYPHKEVVLHGLLGNPKGSEIPLSQLEHSCHTHFSNTDSFARGNKLQ